MSTSGTYWEKDCDYCNQDFFTGERRGDKTQLGRAVTSASSRKETIFDNMSSCVCIFFELRQGSAWEIQMHTWFRTSCHKYLRLQMGGFALVDLPVRTLTQDACKRPLYLHICIPASDGKCVQLSMKKLFRLVLCPRHHFFSISFFSIFLWMQFKPGLKVSPNASTITMSPLTPPPCGSGLVSTVVIDPSGPSSHIQQWVEQNHH